MIMVRNQRTVLTMTSSYLPGYKGGGLIRSLANLVETLGDEFSFKIITMDRDCGDSRTYTGVNINSWQLVGKADVYYASPKTLSIFALRSPLLEAEHNVLYLNSFFSYPFTIKPLILRRLGLISRTPVILAPRGEFSQGALAIKKLKKRAYLAIAKVFGLYRSVIWQASSEHEETDIRRWFGKHVPVIVAPDLPSQSDRQKEHQLFQDKDTGSLKLVFLSRVSRKKHLDYALKILKGIRGEVQFNIYGPLEDMNYWSECQKSISLLPQNIKVQHRGAIMPDQVIGVMASHDLFFFPTHGENFGHVILEALLAGCPVLISDQTPWRDLEKKGIGWDIPLDQPGRFQSVLQQWVEMDRESRQAWSQRAREYGLKYSCAKSTLEKNRLLFHTALSWGDE